MEEVKLPEYNHSYDDVFNEWIRTHLPRLTITPEQL